MGRTRAEYAALLSMCDASLGRVLDRFDELDLWADTLLMVCTDHGFLLGEHGWWGKNVQPWYDENIHTPLFVWDPAAGTRAAARPELVQTIDFGPTLLDFFGLHPPRHARPIPVAVAARAGPRSAPRGRAVRCVRRARQRDRRPLRLHARTRWAGQRAVVRAHPDADAHGVPLHPGRVGARELVGPLPFTKNVPVLRVPGFAIGDPFIFGTVLFDLDTDPQQEHPIVDDELELRMIDLLLALMRANDAPADQFARLGLPTRAPPTPGTCWRGRNCRSTGRPSNHCPLPRTSPPSRRGSPRPSPISSPPSAPARSSRPRSVRRSPASPSRPARPPCSNWPPSARC